MPHAVKDTIKEPQRFRDREREIELEAALRRFWEFTRSAVSLDTLTDDMQDECWALDALGKKLLRSKTTPDSH